MYFEENARAFKEYAPYLEDLATDPVATDRDLIVESQPTRTEDKVLSIDMNGQKTFLNSRYNPQNEAKMWAEQYHVKNLDSVVVMYGLGNGIFLKELMKIMNDNVIYIIYEPSYLVFQHVLAEYDLVSVVSTGRVFFIVQGLNESEFSNFLAYTLTWDNLYSKIQCVHPQYDRLFPQEYELFIDAIKKNTLNCLVLKNTSSKLGTQLVHNTISNLRFLNKAITIDELKDKFPEDSSVIIVAAGPSLNKNIEELKLAKGKAIIVAVDRAYETLLEHNIEPDFLVIIDAKKERRHCGNKEEFSVPLFCKLEASEEILQAHKGMKIIFNCEQYMEQLWEKQGISFHSILTGTSVATAAFSIAIFMNWKRIIFVGLDLAYDGELSHAGPYQELHSERKEIDLSVEGYYGEIVHTRPDWYGFLTWFENSIVKLPEWDVIDATEGGARIKGARNIALRDAISEYCTINFDCNKIIDNIEVTFNNDKLRGLADGLQSDSNDLSLIKREAKKAIKLCKLALTESKINKNEFYNKFTKINKKIERLSVFILVDTYVTGISTDEIQKMSFMTQNKEQDERLTYENMNKIYQSLLEACDTISTNLKDIITQLKQVE